MKRAKWQVASGKGDVLSKRDSDIIYVDKFEKPFTSWINKVKNISDCIVLKEESEDICFHNTIESLKLDTFIDINEKIYESLRFSLGKQELKNNNIDRSTQQMPNMKMIIAQV